MTFSLNSINPSSGINKNSDPKNIQKGSAPLHTFDMDAKRPVPTHPDKSSLPSPHQLIQDKKKPEKTTQIAQKRLAELKKMSEKKTSTKEKNNKTRSKKNTHPYSAASDSLSKELLDLLDLENRGEGDSLMGLLSAELEERVQGFMNQLTSSTNSEFSGIIKTFLSPDLVELSDIISHHILQVEIGDQIEWNIELTSGIFEGATLTLVEYRTAPKEYNLIFSNLSAEAQVLLEMKKEFLQKQLITQNVLINQVITTRSEHSTASDFFRHFQEESDQQQDQNERKEKPEEEEPLLI